MRRVGLGRFLGVLGGLSVVAGGVVGVLGGLRVVALFVVLGCLLGMLGGFLVALRCLAAVFRCRVAPWSVSSFRGRPRQTALARRCTTL